MADEDRAPALAAQLARDPPWPVTGVAERERDDPLLDKRRPLVGQPRPLSLPRPQDLQPVPLDPPLPDVIGRAVDPEHAAGLAHARPRGMIEHPQPVAEQCVILRHAAHSFALDLAVEAESEPRTGRRPTRAPSTLTRSKRRTTRVSGPLGDSPA